jgi:GNAT superfamily N-acetyltransferase
MAKQLEIADWTEIQRVLKETYEIWSPGLNRDSYRDFVLTQMAHPWCRSNYYYLILRDKQKSKTPAASLKYYNLSLSYRGKSLKFAGFGAIYTRKELRGQGYATELIKLALDRAWYDGCHGTILFSDIAPSFYADFGFFDMNNEKFVLSLKQKTESAGTASASPTGDTTVPPRNGVAITEGERASKMNLSVGSMLGRIDHGHTGPEDWVTGFTVDDDIVVQCRHLSTNADQIDFMTRHYGRWLRKQAYGIERSSTYFHFKIMRENYLAQKSRLSWPRLELLSIDHKDAAGYAIIEYGGRVVRVLELVGDERTRGLLWRGLIARAQDIDASRISGWESILSDFQPGFTINQLATIDTTVRDACDGLGFFEKVKGRTMILPFKEEYEEWFTVCPCPILELDHL